MRVLRLGPRPFSDLSAARLMGVWAARPRSGMTRFEKDCLIVFLIVAVLYVGYKSVDSDKPAPASPAAKPGEIGKVVSPVPGGQFTSGFGRRWGKAHRGSDIAAPIGTPILAIADGTVTVAGPASGFGLWMHVKHADGTVSIYGHMNTMTGADGKPVRVGTRVKAGQQIATVGMRGESTGPHLHLEIAPKGIAPDGSRAVVDPKPWFAKHRAQLT